MYAALETTLSTRGRATSSCRIAFVGASMRLASLQTRQRTSHESPGILALSRFGIVRFHRDRFSCPHRDIAGVFRSRSECGGQDKGRPLTRVIA
jgi:hypothetical protein